MKCKDKNCICRCGDGIQCNLNHTDSCDYFHREENLYKVLDFVERHNKQDKEKDVANSANELSKLLYDPTP